VGLSEGEEIVTLAFFVLMQYRLVTDRRTDGRTRCFIHSFIHSYSFNKMDLTKRKTMYKSNEKNSKMSVKCLMLK